jgi:hypothetical protein
MMAARRRERAPAWYLASFESIKASTLALRITQEGLDEIRADWGLEAVELAPPGRAEQLLQSAD